MAAPRLYAGYIKNKSHGSESILVTINNLWLKSYLSFVKWVADKMRSLNTLAMLLTLFLNHSYNKKINKNYNSNFSTLTEDTFSPSSVKIHFTLSPFEIPSLSTISLGIVTLNEPDWRLA